MVPRVPAHVVPSETLVSSTCLQRDSSTGIMASAIGASLYGSIHPALVDEEQEWWFRALQNLARYGFVNDSLAQHVYDLLQSRRDDEKEAATPGRSSAENISPSTSTSRCSTPVVIDNPDDVTTPRSQEEGEQSYRWWETATADSQK